MGEAAVRQGGFHQRPRLMLQAIGIGFLVLLALTSPGVAQTAPTGTAASANPYAAIAAGSASAGIIAPGAGGTGASSPTAAPVNAGALFTAGAPVAAGARTGSTGTTRAPSAAAGASVGAAAPAWLLCPRNETGMAALLAGGDLGCAP